MDPKTFSPIAPKFASTNPYIKAKFDTVKISSKLFIMLMSSCYGQPATISTSPGFAIYSNYNYRIHIETLCFLAHPS